MYEPIIDALRRGAAAEALTAAREAVDAQPEDPAAHRLLASALRLDGDRDAALAAVDRAIELQPEDARLHLERAGLLLDGRQLDAAEAELARTIGLDPNQFPAYILQAQLALARGDLDQADSVIKVAARIAPEHPQVAAVEGTLALRRGDADRGLSILSRAAQRFPDEAILRNALGFAYAAKGHFAFAEQAFRGLLERKPSNPLRAIVADMVRRQGRPGEAVDELLPILDSEPGNPGLRRLVGEMELEAGRFDSAQARLKALLSEYPRDRRTIVALTEAWRRGGADDDARQTLEGLLATHADVPDLWYARLLFEEFAGDAAREVVERWLAAMPDFVPALEARATLHQQAGETAQADAIARRITELDPGHAGAELRVVDGLMRTDPDAAVTQIEGLLAKAGDENIKRGLRQLLGRAFDTAGQHDAALATWVELQTEMVPQRLPLPPLSDSLPALPEMAPVPEKAPGVAFLWGAPGSLVERIALTLEHARMPLRADRFSAQPPRDPVQRYGTPAALVDGSLDPHFLISQWRATHAARRVENGSLIDWLLWWDNALLIALRTQLPAARLLIALRDPRDMLVGWLAFGAPMPFAMESPEAAAQWMARALGQIADLHEQDLFPHALIRLDDSATDPAAIAGAVGEALGVELPPLPPGAQGPDHYAPGHWRHYAEPLATAFAILAPVAERLGYPAR
ncbi:tetratricopeptide repeat protein [Marilutibacter alkalisoli]|nr:tetratricopeptide repeat protein [Lysobacter alkalisoli]